MTLQRTTAPGTTTDAAHDAAHDAAPDAAAVNDAAVNDVAANDVAQEVIVENAAADGAPRRHAFAFWHEGVLLALLLALTAWAWRADASFVNPPTQIELLGHVWELAILAVPMTLVIISGGIDLSVGSTMALCAVVLGLAHEAGAPLGVSVSLAILTGIAAGTLNGVFVARLRVHPLLVTLATLAAYRGVAEGISQARPISGFPESFGWLGRGHVAGVPVPGLIFAAVAMAAAVTLSRATAGVWLRAIGHNETAARFSGVPVERVRIWLYTLSGAAAGICAVLFVSRRNTAKADIGAGLELDVITAVVLGGTSIFGGRGGIGGTLLGVLLIHQTREWVSWHWNRDELNLIVLGALLIFSVLLNRFLSKER